MSKKLPDTWSAFGERAERMKIGSVITIPADQYQKLYYSCLVLGHRIKRRKDRQRKGFINCERVK